MAGCDSGRTLLGRDPAMGASVGHVPDMGAAETRLAIDAATCAFAGWSGITATERADVPGLERLSAGMVGVNSGLITTEVAPVGVSSILVWGEKAETSTSKNSWT